MKCYCCGAPISGGQARCQYCGHRLTRLYYLPVWGISGGVVGSLLGFTLWNMAGALVLGLFGIIVCEVAGRLTLHARGSA
jgi:hypothetical protein